MPADPSLEAKPNGQHSDVGVANVLPQGLPLQASDPVGAAAVALSSDPQSPKPVGKNPAYRVWRGVSEAERNERLHSVITRFVNDEKLADIAQDIGLSHSALCMALLEYAEDDWKRAQVARAVTRLEKARAGRDAASDMLNLVRARDDEKSAQWELERLLRRLYGTDVPQNLTVPIQINIGIARQQKQGNAQSDAQVIDVEPGTTDSKSVG